jgi:tellurite resistance protein TerC
VLYVALGGLAVVVAAAFWLETRQGAEHPGAQMRRALAWSGLWLALGLLPTLLYGVIEGGRPASSYAAVYLIERALSLDNVFVFAVLIATFEIPAAERDRQVSLGAISAFLLRVPAIVGGVALFEASSVVSYALGALLVVLAYNTARASGEEQAPGQGRVLAFMQRRLPVSDHVPRRWIVVHEGRRQLTPGLVCLLAIMFADLTFAVDSIPAALAISHDTTLLLAANLLALMGLRAMYQLVTVARERLRYMDHTIALLLALVGVKLLLAHVVHIGPLASLLIVLVVLAAGFLASLRSRPSPMSPSGGPTSTPFP